MVTQASVPVPARMPEKLAGWTLQRLPPPIPEDHAGKLFAGRYLLRRKIGGGGMSTIYEARDATLGVPVVVKIMRADLPSDPVDRFRREALVLARLSHEHIGHIIDRQDPEDGPRFLVAEYIDGVDLALLRRRGPMPAAVVLQIGLQVSAALAYAHAEGVIHRDVKPSNLMLVRHPGGDVFAKVIDFGIAKLARGSELGDDTPAGARRKTRGVVPGTAPYWSGQEGPERDVYALALTLAELLTGGEPDPTVDLGRDDIPAKLSRTIEATLRAEVLTMDALHAALRDANAQDRGEAEAERRRYVARIFQVEPAHAAPASVDAPRFGDRYLVCGELGEGGMGRVQVVFDAVTRRRVALKTIHPRCAGMKNLEHRFQREAWALAAIEHLGAPTLYDSGAAPEPFFTMEIVEGMSLTAALRQGKLDPQRALSVAIDLAGILRAAHEVGVIHRDVKPDNIILGPDDRVRLLDFGACLLMPRFHQRHLLFPATPPEQRYATGELEAVGTPGYTAPEVLEMRGGAGPRSDIYSVCVVLYEMLTGRRYEDPASGRAQSIEPGEFPSTLGPIADVLRRGTARELDDRMWSMSGLVRALEILRAGLLAAQRRRQIALIAIFAVVTTVVMMGLAALLLRGERAETATPAVPVPAVPPEQSAIGVPDRTAAPAPVTEPVRSPPSDQPPVPPAAVPQPAPEDPPSSAPTLLTVAKVRARLATRHQRLKECGAPLLVLNLTIIEGRPTLAAVNGMPAGDPLHLCVRDGLRGITFSPRHTPESFAATINLDLGTK